MQIHLCSDEDVPSLLENPLRTDFKGFLDCNAAFSRDDELPT